MAIIALPALAEARAGAGSSSGSRGGKTVTTIQGVPVAETALKALAGELKRLCGTGGTVKDGVIEIQGDHRDKIVAALMQRGYTVKLAGG